MRNRMLGYGKVVLVVVGVIFAFGCDIQHKLEHRFDQETAVIEAAVAGKPVNMWEFEHAVRILRESSRDFPRHLEERGMTLDQIMVVVNGQFQVQIVPK